MLDPRIKDITGQVFGQLTVLQYAYSENKATYWKCLCTCGRETISRRSSLVNGKKLSCGKCDWSRIRKGHSAVDLSGQKFGRLTVIEPTSNRSENRSVIWKCLCECGNYCYVSVDMLHKGDTVSCGCYNKEVRTKWRTEEELRLSKIYSGIQQRCDNPNKNCFNRYGGRGVILCEEWRQNPRAFVDWCIKNGSAKGLQIDRIDNNGPYAPWNCRWVTPKINQNNKSSNRLITVDETTRTIADWADLLGISRHTLYRKSDDAIEKFIREKIRTER